MTGRSWCSPQAPSTRTCAPARCPAILKASIVGDGVYEKRSTRTPARSSASLSSRTSRCSAPDSASCCATAASSIPSTIDHYLARGGYAALAQAASLPPGGRHRAVRRAGLARPRRGRLPTWQKWTVLPRRRESDASYLICNADEGDPGAFMNRSLIEGDPHAVLEGMLIAGYAIGAARRATSTSAPSTRWPIQRLRTALAADAQARPARRRHPGQRLLVRHHAQGGRRRLRLRRGDGAHRQPSRAGAGMPRTRPPFPAVAGLLGKPTIINNVETLATLPCDHRQRAPSGTRLRAPRRPRAPRPSRSPARCAARGSSRCPFGHDAAPGHLRHRRRRSPRRFKAVQTGGPVGRLPAARSFSTRRSTTRAWRPPARSWAPAADRDRRRHLHGRHRHATSSASRRGRVCGKCVPCRVGTGHLVDILDRDLRRQGRARRPRAARAARPRDQGAARSAGSGRRRPTRCSRRSSTSATSSWSTSSSERCRAVVCRDLVEYRIIPASAPAASAACRSAPPAPSPARAPRRTTSTRRSASSAAPATRSAGSTPSPATPSCIESRGRMRTEPLPRADARLLA